MRTSLLAAIASTGLATCVTAQTTLPTVGLFDFPVQPLATAQEAGNLFNTICISPEGNVAAAFTAMRRADFAQLEGASAGRYITPDFQVGFDLRFDDSDTYQNCSMRWVTTDTAMSAAAIAQSFQDNLPPNVLVDVVRVEPMDGTTTNLLTIPARANGDELKVIVLFWSSF